MGLEDAALLTQWKPSYKRGFAMQSLLAILGFGLGMGAWWQSGQAFLLVGAVFMIANWPFTLVAIMPTNLLLMRIDPASGDTRIRALLVKWNRLHAVRTALGAFACLCFVVGMVR